MTDAQTIEYRSTSTGSAGEVDPVRFGLRLSVWFKIGVVSTLFCCLFWPNLRRLWEKTNPFTGEANWQHAIFVPIIGLYYLYVNRDPLRAARAKTCWPGLFILILGILVFGYGIWPGQNDFVKDFGMVVTLFGVVLLLSGRQVMKIAWFPIAFLVCALPWPGLVYSAAALPLQQLAAKVAVYTLQLTGVSSFADGSKIFIYGHNNALRTLNVAEACAGLKSLMTFISVAAAVAFLSSRPLWQRLIICFSAIPIAIGCNVMRVAGQGLLDHYVSQQLSENFAHQFVGLIMLIPAFLLIFMVGWVLDKIFIEEADTDRNEGPRVIRRRELAGSPAAAANVSPVSPSAGQTKHDAAPVAVAAASLQAVRAQPASNATLPAKPAVFAKPAVSTKLATPASPVKPQISQPVAPVMSAPHARSVQPAMSSAPVKPAIAAPLGTLATPDSVKSSKPPVKAPTAPSLTTTATPPPSTRLAPRTFSKRGVPPTMAPPKLSGNEGKTA